MALTGRYQVDREVVGLLPGELFVHTIVWLPFHTGWAYVTGAWVVAASITSRKPATAA